MTTIQRLDPRKKYPRWNPKAPGMVETGDNVFRFIGCRQLTRAEMEANANGECVCALLVRENGFIGEKNQQGACLPCRMAGWHGDDGAHCDNCPSATEAGVPK